MCFHLYSFPRRGHTTRACDGAEYHSNGETVGRRSLHLLFPLLTAQQQPNGFSFYQEKPITSGRVCSLSSRSEQMAAKVPTAATACDICDMCSQTADLLRATAEVGSKPHTQQDSMATFQLTKQAFPTTNVTPLMSHCCLHSDALYYSEHSLVT